MQRIQKNKSHSKVREAIPHEESHVSKDSKHGQSDISHEFSALEGLDELLKDIDAVLASLSEDTFTNYVQKGGE